METWLILMGVLLPLAPLLQIADRRLSAPGRRQAAVPLETKSPRA